jgi:hypothetical protein
MPEREKLVSTLRQCVEAAGFTFVASGKCSAGGGTVQRAENRNWGICDECKDAKMIVSFEHFAAGFQYLSEKPFLPLEFGAIPLYHGNGQSFMDACGLNTKRLIDVSHFPTYSLFCQHVVDMLKLPSRLQALADREYGALRLDRLWEPVEQFTSTLPRVRAMARKRRIRVNAGRNPPMLKEWLPRILHVPPERLEYVRMGPYDIVIVGCCFGKHTISSWWS